MDYCLCHSLISFCLTSIFHSVCLLLSVLSNYFASLPPLSLCLSVYLSLSLSFLISFMSIYIFYTNKLQLHLNFEKKTGVEQKKTG